MTENLEKRMIVRLDKFLFRLQSQILGALLPEVRELSKEREACILGAAGKETSNKEGK
jgi:hypothetical protein